MILRVKKLGKVLIFDGRLKCSINSSQIRLEDDNQMVLCTSPQIQVDLSPQTYAKVETVLSSLADANPIGYELYTDGSAVPNPGPGGWGAVLYHNGQEVNNLSGGHAKTGNGKMEVTAMVQGLSLIPEGEECQVWSDAQYVVNTIGQGILTGSPKGWIAGWKRNGWKKKDGNPPENLKEIKELYDALMAHVKAGSKLTFSWTKAHVGTIGNERADELANEGRKAGV